MKVPTSMVAAAAILAISTFVNSQSLDRPDPIGEATARATALASDVAVSELLVIEPLADSREPFCGGAESVPAVASDGETALLDGLAAFIWKRAGEENQNFVARAAVTPRAAEWEVPACGGELVMTAAPVPHPAATPVDFSSFAMAVSLGFASSAPMVPEPASGLLTVISGGFFLIRRRR